MVNCILLAAGESRRFGSPKALAQIKGQTVIATLTQRLIGAKLNRVIVVLGADADLIAPRIPENPCLTVIVNKDFAQGQTSSCRAGLEALPPGTRGAMLLPVDVPFVKKETIEVLVQTFLEKQPLILMPTFAGGFGHPPIFASNLFPEFKDLKNTEPLHAVQRRHAKSIFEVPVTDEGVRATFNTPGELNLLLQRF
jgi:molybdenum cofactor cytidylyltransferase